MRKQASCLPKGSKIFKVQKIASFASTQSIASLKTNVRDNCGSVEIESVKCLQVVFKDYIHSQPESTSVSC